MAEALVTLDVRDGVATIAINRPDALNALNEGARDELCAAFGQAGSDDSAGAVVLTGAGRRAFCAGQDIREAITFDGDRGARWAGELETTYRTVRSFEKPVVAALHGVAAGLGFQLAMMADIRIAAETARLGQTEINVGLPGISGPWIMREIMGLSHTIEMTLTGRLVGAEECLALGLVNEVVAPDALAARARTCAQALAAKPRLAMAATKRRLWQMIEPGFTETMEIAARTHREAFASGEPQKVMRAFLDQRAKRG